jgi:hypothetical protein
MQKIKRILERMSPFIVFLILALILIAIPLWKQQTYLGIDSMFHYNRFYDAAMQLKAHKISYFQTNYGFLQTGRILSALYGPLLAYLGGFLLLICGNWHQFQMLTDLLVLVIAALGMYKLSRVNHVGKKPAILVGFLYMYSSVVVQWVTSQQFTGFGAAIMPFLMLFATEMVRKHDVSMLKFAFTMSVLIQTHLMSSVIGFLGLLPFFVVGLVTSPDAKTRRQLILHNVGAGLITIGLTINVWYNLITLNADNQLLPVYPVLTVRTHGFNLDVYSLFNILKPTEALLFVFVLIFVLRRFKSIDTLSRTLAFSGLGFLILSWSHFPWGIVQRVLPSITYTLQFPKRFLVLAFIFLILLFGRILTMKLSKQDSHYRIIQWILVFIVAGSVGLDFYAVHQRSEGYTELNIRHHRNNANDNSLYYYFKKHHHSVQKDTESHHVGYLIHDYIKATPDYAPVKHVIKDNVSYNRFNPYLRYYREFIAPNHSKKWHYQHKVLANGVLRLTWHTHQAQRMMIPLMKYANTQVTLNGKKMNHVSTSQLGAIIVHAKTGKNVVKIHYVTSFVTRLMMILSWIAWLLFGGFIIVRRFH